ncbi:MULTISPECIES: ATP-binding protein [unclassified Bradyrhizobium]|uniref:ATP-binding protein n=1 Tax=unclassified Bradyrhizobium TaxID=2631580 RepID=UPI0028EC0A83|nr:MULTISPECIES: ATP-binding protein [unclassified Bradyrhizobium]
MSSIDQREAWTTLIAASGRHSVSQRARQSIQSRLFRIILMLSVPAFVGLAALAWGLYQHEREQASQGALATVRALAAALDRDLAGTSSAAQVLAESAALATDDLGAFYKEAKGSLPHLEGSAVVVADAAGQQVVNTALPYGAPLPRRSDLANHRKVFETGKPSVSDIFIGAVSKRPALSIDVPVFREGKVKYTLGVALGIERLNGLFANQKLPAGWIATVTDSAGIIVARTHDPELIGRPAPVRLADIKSSRPNVVDTYRADGTPILVGFGRSERSNWTVALGIPLSDLYRRPNSILLYGITGVFCVLLVGLIAVMYEAKRIARGVRSLLPAALASGSDETTAAARSHVQEIDDVAVAIERARRLLHQRTLERDNAEMAIAARNLADEMFRLAVEACPNGMLMVDAEGRISMVNNELERQFGYTRQELIGQPVDMLVPERSRVRNAVLQHAFNLRPETRQMESGRELTGLKKNGTEFPIEVGLNPIRVGQGLMILSVVVDVSERRRAERLKDEFVATVSHELRTPLTSVTGSLGLLVGCWSKTIPEPAARLLSIAHANSERLVRLVNDILDMERIEAGDDTFNLRRVEVRSLVGRVVEENRGYADDVGVRVELGAGVVGVYANADPERLAQAVANLVSNAIKFSSAGGSVQVTVEDNGDSLRIAVRDHGPGIPEDFEPHLFERFAQADATDTRQKGGTGLGLSIVKQIMARLGGKAGFENADGGGALFFVELPMWDDTVGGAIEIATTGSPSRILLCETDPVVKQAVRMKLAPAGLTVDFAHSVQAALLRSSANRYAAIVIGLPLDEIECRDVAARIRRIPHQRNTTIIIACDASAGGQADAGLREMSDLQWIRRPIDVEQLVSQLSATVPSSRPRPRVLHVDDDPETLVAVAHELETMADMVSAGSLEAARRVLATEHIDLAIVDVRLGAEPGLDLLPHLRDRAGKIIPVIIFSNSDQNLPEDDQQQLTFSRKTSPLERLASIVRDRLGLSPLLSVREVA